MYVGNQATKSVTIWRENYRLGNIRHFTSILQGTIEIKDATVGGLVVHDTDKQAATSLRARTIRNSLTGRLFSTLTFPGSTVISPVLSSLLKMTGCPPRSVSKDLPNSGSIISSWKYNLVSHVLDGARGGVTDIQQ